MPPIPKTPRLALITPEDFAKKIGERLIEQVGLLVEATSGGDPPVSMDERTFPIFSTMLELAVFAKTGGGLSARATSAALGKVSRVYYGSAARPTMEPLGDQGDIIGVVIIAAQARIAIAIGAPVGHQALAALAGVGPSRIRALSTGKKPVLRRLGAERSGTIEPRSAALWLRAQSVAGFEK